MKTLAIVALSLATAISSVPPAEAFPIAPAVKPQATDIQHVQFSYERGEHAKGVCRLPSCRRDYRESRRGYRDYRRSFYRDRYRDRRYRRYYRDDDNDFGAFIGGLATGAIVGGVLSQRPRYSGGNAHTEWCYARYRSYRAWDNTYQPYGGPRRQCYSPYS
ncbi:BA14K family protein [Sinorhizobium psoraleae]|uniref:Lectin-like protein BA14k n=1 Tax=Sinorhizobium psoraleae TaxID=520838 RepID=A0ABT4KFU3_9HYPH|nr:BA14K family protein [Sinorhizobium psoraleae]MCZ4089862.1 BA14K family protein [Sinorhizobium psoraleae]